MHRISKTISVFARVHSVLLIALCALCLGAFVFAMIFLHERNVARDHADTDNQWSLIARPITSRDHVIGDVSAPVQLVVYADFQCRYCGDFFKSVVPRLQKQFGDKIVFAFRHLPLSGQPQAEPEADASECVYQLGGNTAFWKFAYEMYDIPGFYEGIDLSRLPDLAEKAGVDRSQFIACEQAGGGKARVAQDKIEGSIAGLNITPSTILKSAHRALTVKDDYYAPLAAGVSYLLQAEAWITKVSH